MPASVAALRALGSRPVRLVTAAGAFTGIVLQSRLSDDAIMVMLEPEGGGEAVVVALEAIDEIASYR